MKKLIIIFLSILLFTSCAYYEDEVIFHDNLWYYRNVNSLNNKLNKLRIKRHKDYYDFKIYKIDSIFRDTLWLSDLNPKDKIIRIKLLKFRYN